MTNIRDSLTNKTPVSRPDEGQLQGPQTPRSAPFSSCFEKRPLTTSATPSPGLGAAPPSLAHQDPFSIAQRKIRSFFADPKVPQPPPYVGGLLAPVRCPMRQVFAPHSPGPKTLPPHGMELSPKQQALCNDLPCMTKFIVTSFPEPRQFEQVCDTFGLDYRHEELAEAKEFISGLNRENFLPFTRDPPSVDLQYAIALGICEIRRVVHAQSRLRACEYAFDRLAFEVVTRRHALNERFREAWLREACERGSADRLHAEIRGLQQDRYGRFSVSPDLQAFLDRFDARYSIGLGNCNAVALAYAAKRSRPAFARAAERTVHATPTGSRSVRFVQARINGMLPRLDFAEGMRLPDGAIAAVNRYPGTLEKFYQLRMLSWALQMLIHESRLGTEARHYAIMLAQVDPTGRVLAHVIYFGTRPLQIADQHGVELVDDSMYTGLAVLAWVMSIQMEINCFAIYELAHMQGGIEKTASSLEEEARRVVALKTQYQSTTIVDLTEDVASDDADDYRAHMKAWLAGPPVAQSDLFLARKYVFEGNRFRPPTRVKDSTRVCSSLRNDDFC